VVRHDNVWEVIGTGKERARVAFARLEGGRIVYQLQSVLALLVLDGAAVDAATDTTTATAEAFAFPLLALLAAIHLCTRFKAPINRAVRRLASSLLTKARGWLDSRRAALLSAPRLHAHLVATTGTVVLAVAARCFR
jgi:hypothetical protein